MKVSLNWLREWVELPADADAVAHRLTMGGIEAGVEPQGRDPLQGVVLGRIMNVMAHPQGDRLRVCEVDVGQTDPLSIVCGAPNVAGGEMAAVALPGAVLPGGVRIEESMIRGMKSAGMLCSAKELGLADKSDGLVYFDRKAQAGAPLAQHLQLRDEILDLEFTPNRGDCLSVAGLARELSALYSLPVHAPQIAAVEAKVEDTLPVRLEDAQACPTYVGRVIRGIDSTARIPDWMAERLRRSGLRSLHPVVDITNYVMLELGQPMHAFDVARLVGGIHVRRARPGEQLLLLNEQTITLDPRDLVIADGEKPLALAGVMGGSDSGMSAQSNTVFLESAYFAPEVVAGAGRRYMLNSDALYRFERGVDPDLPARALERATQLVLEICGGWTGPVIHEGRTRLEPLRITLRHARLTALLGHDIPASDVERHLQALGIVLHASAPGEWEARIPAWRHDLRIEPDLIEEVARLYGYDNIPARPYPAQLAPAPVQEAQRALPQVRQTLVARGFQEVVTYSFVNPRIEAVLTPAAKALPLDNPIAETMGVMRTTLWSGLIPAWLYNHQRQQKRVKLFEVGVCFNQISGRVVETQRIAGLVAGTALPEQWGLAASEFDFYDLKSDLEALLAGAEFSFDPAEQPALQPGRSALVRHKGRPAGWLGALHPRVVRELDLPEAPYVFEIAWPVIREIGVPAYRPVSDYPSARRDLALVVQETVTSGTITTAARRAGGARLREVRVFDVYRGSGLPNGCKSIALGLIFQDNSRTLTDQEVDAAVQTVASRLADELGASIRG